MNRNATRIFFFVYSANIVVVSVYKYIIYGLCLVFTVVTAVSNSVIKLPFIVKIRFNYLPQLRLIFL